MIGKLVFFCVFFQVVCSSAFAQPTFKTGEFRFRVYSQNGEVLFQDKNAVVTIDWLDKSATPPGPFVKRDIGQLESGYFYYRPMMSPAGGIVAPDIYFQVVHQKDTMRLFGINKFNKELAMLDSVPFLPGDFYLKYQLLPMLNAVPTQQTVACGFNWDAFKTPQNSFQLSCFAPQFVYKKESEDFENLMGNVVNESTYTIENKADKIELKDKDGKVVVSNLKANAKIYAYSNKQKDIVAFDLPDFSNKHFTYLLFKDSVDNCFQAGVLPSDFYPYLIFRHEKEWYSLATCSLKTGLLPEVTGIFKLNLSTSLAAADSQMHQQVNAFFADSIAALAQKAIDLEEASWQALVDSLTASQLSNSKANPTFFDKPVRLILANTDTFATLTLIDSVFTLTVFRSNTDLANMGFAVRKVYSGKYTIEGKEIDIEFLENSRATKRTFYMIATKKQFRMVERKTRKSLLFNRVKRLY